MKPRMSSARMSGSAAFNAAWCRSHQAAARKALAGAKPKRHLMGWAAMALIIS